MYRRPPQAYFLHHSGHRFNAHQSSHNSSKLHHHQDQVNQPPDPAEPHFSSEHQMTANSPSYHMGASGTYISCSSELRFPAEGYKPPLIVTVVNIDQTRSATTCGGSCASNRLVAFSIGLRPRFARTNNQSAFLTVLVGTATTTAFAGVA